MPREPSVRVAFQGARGAYSEEAAGGALGGEPDRTVEPLPRETFSAVFDAVESGEADRGIVPIENSLAGSVRRNDDLLLERSATVVGESYLRIRHCLMALPGTRTEELSTVLSHPQALAQCRETLRELLPGAERRAAADTAGSARRVRREELAGVAAVASERAASVYGLEVLRRGVEDDPGNYTRFLLLGREAVDPGPDAKTSLLFSAPDEPGLLYRCLRAFAERDIDLTRIESRPLVGRPWEYVFYLDFRGRADREPARRALEELEGITDVLRVLGSYPRAEF